MHSMSALDTVNTNFFTALTYEASCTQPAASDYGVYLPHGCSLRFGLTGLHVHEWENVPRKYIALH